MEKTVRTRFAPSPTGFMHIGNLRTGLYAYLFARHNGGKFILRIEDTDRERMVEGAEQMVYRTLAAAGIDYDEGPDRDGGVGPYVQSERAGIYREYAEKLVELGGAYYCFCTKERLESLHGENGTHTYDRHCRDLSPDEVKARLAAGEPYVIRQKVPDGVVSSYRDMVFGEISVSAEDIEDGVLLKFIYDAFGWERPQYMHLPPIMKDATRKLSKRYGDANFEDFIAKGYLPAAVVNYVALLGWCPKNNAEKMTMEEMIELFDVDGISVSGSIFDEAKMRWLNGEYLKAMTEEEFFAAAEPWIEKSKAARFDKREIARLMQTRVDVLGEIPEKVNFLDEFGAYDLGMYEHKKMKVDLEVAKRAVKVAESAIEPLTEWTEESIKASVTAAAEEAGMKGGQVMFSMRVALTGQPSTPGGAIEMAVVLGKQESMRRLRFSEGLLEPQG